ncbi:MULTISPECIES: DUF6368 family protein [Micromonospora]|uniref:DUF6368 family protein n=1 Tax=Micromonospora TaxID=1873 RepID=UPI0004C258E2|nr:DUF6368 family protein [Micromonospora globosa]
MAGPCVAVLLPDPWTASHVELFRVWLAEALTNQTGDWWLLREPSRLGWQAESPVTGPMLVEPDDWDVEDPDEATFLARAAGFRPATEVVLASAANGVDDHRFLAHLAVAIAHRYGGLIDLTGPLPVPPPARVRVLDAVEAGTGIEEWWAGSRETLRMLGGAWHEIPYVAAGGTRHIYHVVEPDLLTVWLTHPQFRMVK